MKRLRDQTSDDPSSQAAISLVDGVVSTTSDPDMKRRVWAALVSAETRAVTGFPMLRLPVVVAAAVVLFAAGTAGAVIARHFIAPAFHRAAVAEPVKALPAPPARKAPGRSAPSAESMVVADPLPVEVDSPAPPPAVRPSATRGSRRVSAPASERVSGHATPDAATPSPRERAEVLDAMIALRRDHDASRAGQLLDRYLAARPHGALREEALALAIEAADARGDRASVSNWAHAYQTDYPTGRFAGFARSHLNAP